MNIKQIKDPVYGRILYFVWDYSTDEINEFFHRKYKVDVGFLPMEQGNHVSIAHPEKSKRYFVCKASGTYTVGDYSDLVHETAHYCLEAFADIGITVDDEHSEPFTYYLGYVFEQILAVMLRAKGVAKA